MSDHWLYSETLPTPPAEWTIRGPAAQHARAQRRAPGEAVHLFNGRGVVAGAQVVEAGKQALLVRIGTVQSVPASLPRVAVAVSQPKGERLDWMLEKLTELAVARIIPLECERSVAHVKQERIDRWQRRLIEAGKQAHVAWLPAIDPSVTLKELVGQKGRFTEMLVADTSPATVPILSMAVKVGAQSQPVVLIGPEGGFSEHEREVMAQAGVQAVGLGPTILRTETAAIVAAACLLNATDAQPASSQG
jgi:16S rRNA (uracil1498-N3)-methyltransferase